MNKIILPILFSMLCMQTLGQYDKPYLDSLLQVYNTTKVDSQKVKALVKLGMFYEGENPAKASQYLLKAIDYSLPPSPQEKTYKSLAAYTLSSIAMSMNDSANLFKWAYYAVDYANESNDNKAFLKAYQQMANAYSAIDRYDSAIYYSQQVINRFEALDDSKSTAPAYFAMAQAFDRMHLPHKAIAYIKKAMLVGEVNENADDGMIIPPYMILSELYLELEKYDSVLYYTNKALPVAMKETFYDGVAGLLSSKGQALLKLKNYKDALAAGGENLALIQANGLDGNLANALAVKAIANAGLGNKDSAMHYVQWMDTVYRKNIISQLSWSELYGIWAEVYNLLGNEEKAYEYKEMQLQAFTKYKQDEMAAIAAKNEVVYETAKKEKKIAELNNVTVQQRKVQILIGAGLLLAILAAAFAFYSYRNKKKTAEVLEQSNREKEVFLKEIHHRVKNNLQIISSLLYMQFKDNKDEGMLSQLKQAQDRIKSMALVHNKLYETNDVVHVYLQEYMKDLATGILSSNTPAGKQLNLTVDANETIHLSLDTSISVGLILNELITNSCKYAFANTTTGNITIQLRKEANGYSLQVQDDGAGLPENFDQKQSLGTRLVKNLARQLGGTANFSNRNGTLVSISFKDVEAA